MARYRSPTAQLFGYTDSNVLKGRANRRKLSCTDIHSSRSSQDLGIDPEHAETYDGSPYLILHPIVDRRTPRRHVEWDRLQLHHAVSEMSFTHTAYRHVKRRGM